MSSGNSNETVVLYATFLKEVISPAKNNKNDIKYNHKIMR